MKVTLSLDTANSSKTIVSVSMDGKCTDYSEETKLKTKPQNVLTLIEKALHSEGLRLEQVTAIEVNLGPGSFTGVRVGVAVANTLGWVLKVPVNGEQITMPIYQASKFD